jgi:hypothetical protein
MLKPQQLQLLNQYEQNRAHLNPDQIQMLNIKPQYLIMQQQKIHLQLQQQSQQSQQNHDLDQLLLLELEHVQPIAMMQHDVQNADLNTLLSVHDIVDDLKISLNEQSGKKERDFL